MDMIPFKIVPFNWEPVWELVCAAVLAGIVGVDRELQNKSAGLRTHMMVGVGAAAFTSAAVHAAPDDAARIITGVATGIGFLGAGSIMKSNTGVEGITTAAGVWVVGAVGAACGVGAYTLAVATTLLAALILALVGRLEHRMRRGEASNVTENSGPPSTH
jgi:putative Mg2+ transporter-C (MgtC) family protein